MSLSSNELNHQTYSGDDCVKTWVESFLIERKSQNLTLGTIKYYRENLKVFVNYLDSRNIKYIHEVKPSIIRDFLLLLEQKGHNAGGVHGYFRSVRSFFHFFWNEVEPNYSNPISKVKAPKVPVEPIEGISEQDFFFLFQACPASTYYGIRERAILLILADTGIRASELCRLDVEDINFIDSSILIRQGKGRKPRFVFFGKKTRFQIRKWLKIRGKEGNALFASRQNDRISYTTLRETMRRLSKKARIKTPSLHGFRRYFCLSCLRSGMSEITIARLMGHTTTQLIGRYAKQTTDDLRNNYKSPLDN